MSCCLKDVEFVSRFNESDHQITDNLSPTIVLNEIISSLKDAEFTNQVK